MAKKALALRDFEHYILIMNEPDPKRVTELGEAVHNYNGTNWDEYIEEIVYNANYARFSQNSDLKYALLSTGSKMLVEASPNDRVFGIGLAASDPNAKIPSKWNGKNILGSVLGRVRDAIKLS